MPCPCITYSQTFETDFLLFYYWNHFLFYYLYLQYLHIYIIIKFLGDNKIRGRKNFGFLVQNQTLALVQNHDH